jgi:hypothetical protein
MATESFRGILEVLERYGVEYVVVGGVAAVLQGAPLTTFDIDTLVRVDRANAERLCNALAALDARYREHASLQPTTADIEAGGHLLLMTSQGPLDVLGFIGGGKRFEDVIAFCDAMTIGDLTIRVLPLETLVAEKRALGRDKDRIALKMLEALLKRRNDAKS